MTQHSTPQDTTQSLTLDPTHHPSRHRDIGDAIHHNHPPDQRTAPTPPTDHGDSQDFGEVAERHLLGLGLEARVGVVAHRVPPTAAVENDIRLDQMMVSSLTGFLRLRRWEIGSDQIR